MMERNDSLSRILESLLNKEKVLMTLHNGPDGDSLGSCTAMKYVLEREAGSDVTLISKDDIDENLRRFPCAREIMFGKGLKDFDLKSFDVTVFLDSANLGYTTDLDDEDIRDIFSVNIDHHGTNTRYATLNYVEPDAASTCSILSRMFDKINVGFDKVLADRLLLGVCTDSDFFRFSNGNAALSDAAFLISKGADYYDGVVQPILYNRPLKLEKYFALLMSDLKVDERGFCYSRISYGDIKRLGLNKSEVRLGASTLDGIADMDFVFTLSELESEIKGSFRSNKGYDVLRYAKEMGGGGHKVAAGFTLPRMPLDEAEKRVLEVVERIGVHRA